MHELKRAAFHVPYICITDNHYFVNNFNYFSSSISRNCFVWDRHDLNHEYVIPLMPQVFRLGSKLLRPTIWHAFIGSKTIIIEFMPLLEKKKGVLCALKNIQYCCHSLSILPENYSGPPSYISLLDAKVIHLLYVDTSNTFQQDRRSMYNITQRCVPATTLRVEMK